MQEFDYSNENILSTIEKDYFDRNVYLLQLIDTINDINDCKMIAIDAPWGAGKTVFMHELKYLIVEDKGNIKYNDLCSKKDFETKDLKKMEVFYFNAWENDLIRNPAINLLGSIINKYCLLDLGAQEKLNKCVTFLKKVAIKIATGGILSLDDLKDDDDKLFDELSSIEKIRKNIFDTIETIKSIKNVDKIIIIIDELDRCRPTYAVQMLETIKHLYNNQNLIFLLSTDCTQLSHTIKKLYGESFDSDVYLQRYFYGILTLNNPSLEQYILSELEFNYSDKDFLQMSCHTLIHFYQLNIRDINYLIKKINLIKDKVPGNYPPENVVAFNLFVPWGLTLKFHSISIFNEFKNGKLGKEEFESYLNYDMDFLNKIGKQLSIFNNDIKNEEIKSYLYKMYLYIFENNPNSKFDYETNYDNFDRINRRGIHNLINF